MSLRCDFPYSFTHIPAWVNIFCCILRVAKPNIKDSAPVMYPEPLPCARLHVSLQVLQSYSSPPDWLLEVETAFISATSIHRSTEHVRCLLSSQINKLAGRNLPSSQVPFWNITSLTGTNRTTNTRSPVWKKKRRKPELVLSYHIMGILLWTSFLC